MICTIAHSWGTTCPGFGLAFVLVVFGPLAAMVAAVRWWQAPVRRLNRSVGEPAAKPNAWKLLYAGSAMVFAGSSALVPGAVTGSVPLSVAGIPIFYLAPVSGCLLVAAITRFAATFRTKTNGGHEAGQSVEPDSLSETAPDAPGRAHTVWTIVLALSLGILLVALIPVALGKPWPKFLEDGSRPSAAAEIGLMVCLGLLAVGAGLSAIAVPMTVLQDFSDISKQEKFATAVALSAWALSFGAFYGLGIHASAAATDIRETGTATFAVVDEFITGAHRDAVIVQFVEDGRSTRAYVPVERTFEDGQSVEIFYDPTDPSRVTLEGHSAFLTPRTVVIGAVGAAPLPLAVYGVMTSRRRDERTSTAS